MTAVYLIVALVFACLFLLLLLSTFGATGPSRIYEAREGLFTPAECNFLTVLQRVCASRYTVFGKVRIADIVQVRKGLPSKEWRQAFNRISSKHIDFLLCDPESLEVRCAVELDDASHRRKDRSDRDLFVDRVLEEAGIPLLRVRARASYKPEELVQSLRETLQPPAPAQ